jgi:hypothetical protein
MKDTDDVSNLDNYNVVQQLKVTEETRWPGSV